MAKEDSDPYYYLEPKFDARKLTIHQLTSILSLHDVPVPSVAQRKAVYVELFQKRIQDRASILKKQLNQVKPSSEGIEFVDRKAREGSSNGGASDENADPKEVKVERTARLRKAVWNEPSKSPEDKKRHFDKDDERSLSSDETQDVVLIKKPRVKKESASATVSHHSTSPDLKPRPSTLKRSTMRLSLEEERPLPAIKKQTTPPPPSLDKFRIQPNLPGIRDTVKASPLVDKTENATLRKESESGEDQIFEDQSFAEMDEVFVAESQSFMMHQDQLMTRDMPLNDMLDVLRDMADHSNVVDEDIQERRPSNVKTVQFLTLKSLGQWIAVSLLAFFTIWILFMTPLPTMVVEWALVGVNYTKSQLENLVSSLL